MEDVALLNMLPMFRDRNAKVVVLGGVDEVEAALPDLYHDLVKNVSQVDICTWLTFFNVGDENWSEYAMEALLAYWLF